MGTLNPYRAPFLDGNWIINTATTIGANLFQLKLISEMFEMFVLLIIEINPQSFCFVTGFLFIFTREALPHRGLLHTIFCIEFAEEICRRNLQLLFAGRICHRNLPWLFAARICRRSLPWLFASRICCPHFAVGSLYI